MSNIDHTIPLEQCPGCSSLGKDTDKNNLVTYKDGGRHCHACGYTEKADKTEYIEPKYLGKCVKGGIYSDLKERNIPKHICEFYSYQVGNYSGYFNQNRPKIENEPVHIENYFDSYGNIVNQKLRLLSEKDFGKKGNTSETTGFFGQQCFAPNPNLFIVLTEGAIDAMSIAAATESKGFIFPCISLKDGINSAEKEIGEGMDYLSGFKYVVLAFDNDEVSRPITQKCIGLFDIGKVRVAKFQLKDANEYRKLNKNSEIKNIIWGAEEIKPKYLVKPSDILDEVLQRQEQGVNFPWPTMTKATYGLRSKEIYIIVGSEGTGKSSMMNDMIAHFINKDVKIGLFSFEESPSRTIKKIVGSRIGTPIHLPDSIYDDNIVREETLKLQNKLFLCSQAGSITHTELMNAIRYWAKIEGCKLIIIDNMKGLCFDAENENLFYKKIMLKFQALVQELDITIMLVSHVSKDTISKQAYVSTSPKKLEEYVSMTATDVNKLLVRPGMSWETGRMPEASHIEGTKSIPSLANYIFAVARNYMSEDPQEKNTLRVKCLKSRYWGGGVGMEFSLYYNSNGQLVEVPNQEGIL